MKVVLQRVKNASVSVNGKERGAIKKGLALLVGIHKDDTEEEIEWMCKKIVSLRVFDDEEGKMNLSVKDTGGELLVVSQFTLYGNARKGNRPSYIEAADPEKAEKLYNKVIERLEELTAQPVETGVFGANMQLHIVNDGPVTIILEK